MSGQAVIIPGNAGKYAPERRKELGMTQRELARRSGVSEHTICSFELGEKPGMHLNKLLAVYRASACRSWWKGPTPPMRPPKASVPGSRQSPTSLPRRVGAPMAKIKLFCIIGSVSAGRRTD